MDAPASIPRSSNDGGSVCAVVVTHNRKELLRECLQALSAQTRVPDHVLVIDNASSDNTFALVQSEFPTVQVLQLTENIGGAGGFHVGMKWGHEAGYEWLWLMDDDTIATPSALAELLTSHLRFPAARRPMLLASKVLWTDGSQHFMNGAVAKMERDDLLLAAEQSTLLIRSSTFVSCLVHRELVTDYGLPLADYFIWGDDTEYTARVLRDKLGVMVPRSVVVHKTARKHTALDASPRRFYYHVRNSLWIILQSKAWSRKEKLRYSITLIAWMQRYLSINRYRLEGFVTVLRGLRDGLLKSPRQQDLTHLIRHPRPEVRHGEISVGHE